ncbi:hypothetical protein BH11ACT2_BH11ACT2_03450 [soil metagenome]
MITANEAIQRWVDDALAYPLGIPARLRALLAGGVVHIGDGLFFADAHKSLDLPTPALERFVNTVRLDALPSVRRIPAGTDAWVYECVAVGIALGSAVLEREPAASVVVRVDLDDVEHPDATFSFGRTVDASESTDVAQGVLVMTA